MVSLSFMLDAVMPNARARELRCNQTDAEKRLWRFLRQRQIDGFRFRRQHPIGEYIVDFVCLQAKLIVEVDGGQHAEGLLAYDHRRDSWLVSRGFCVLRIWNAEVFKDLDGVLRRIADALAARSSEGAAAVPPPP